MRLRWIVLDGAEEASFFVASTSLSLSTEVESVSSAAARELLTAPIATPADPLFIFGWEGNPFFVLLLVVFLLALWLQFLTDDDELLLGSSF